MMNSKANKRTSPSDRRQKKIKGFAPDKRQDVRRDEDKSNVLSYYIILTSSLAVLVVLVVLAIIFNN